MTQRIVLDLRNIAKGKKGDSDSFGDEAYTGPRQSITLKADDNQEPEIIVHVDEKGKIAGLECRGYALPFTVVKSSADKLTWIRSLYRRGRYCIIRSIGLYAPRG